MAALLYSKRFIEYPKTCSNRGAPLNAGWQADEPSLNCQAVMVEPNPLVLCVEQDASVHEALKNLLEKSPLELLHASTATEALGIISAQPIDVIISDLSVPGMPAPEFFTKAEAAAPTCQRIILSGKSDADQIVAAINGGGIDAYVSKPWVDDALRKTIEKAAHLATLERENQQLMEVNASQNDALKLQNEELESTVLERTQELTTSNELLNASLDELAASYESMVGLLASVSMLPGTESAATDQKCQLALAIGEEFELEDTELQTLNRCMRLHRIGWVALPYSIRAVPQLEMDQDQKEAFRQHPIFAEALLLSVDKLRDVGKILRFQNEHFDGSGFPDRKVAQGIPMAARIVSVSRDYIDLQRGRICSEALTPETALEQMRVESGRQYDPAIITALASILERGDVFDPVIPEALVPTHALQPDMRLSRDLTTDLGALLLNKGCVLTMELITTLTNLERRSDARLSIYISRDEDDDNHETAA